jgi:thymidylate synthase (FAD)
MKVVVLSHTPNLISVTYKACRTCYSKLSPSTMQEASDEAMYSLIENTLSSGHHSVLEHISFTFSLEGVSRALTHQLVRHRIASYSQQSQRYVTYDANAINYVIPETIKKDEKTLNIYNTIIKNISIGYQQLLDNKIPAEDARYLLPNATTSNIVVTMNFREILNFCKIRLCHRAQWEIFQATELMKQEVTDINHFLGKFLKPKCHHLGYCEETHSCGKYTFPTKNSKGDISK